LRSPSVIAFRAVALFLLLACPCLVFGQERKPTNQIGIGVATERGYSPETGVLEDPLSAPFRWTFWNFFGSSQTLGIAVGGSLIRQTVSLGRWWPSIAGSSWSVGVAFLMDHQLHQNVLQDLVGTNFTDGQFDIAAPDPYDSRADWLAAMQNGATIPTEYLMTYESSDAGIGFTFDYHATWRSMRLGLKGGISSGVRFLSYDFGNFRPYELVLRQDEGRWLLIDRLYPTFYLDSRDSLLNTTSGFHLSQGIEYTGGLLFGERHSVRTDSVVEGYLPLVKTPVTENRDFVLVLAGRSAFSAILPQFAYWSPSADVAATWGWFGPVAESAELLHLDQMNSARGWVEKTGTYGAEAMWNSKLELRLQIARKVLWAVAFVDATGIWNTPADIFPFSPNAFLYSFGAGLRLTTPWIPLRAYVVKGFQVGAGAAPADAQLFVLTLGGEVF
jgi:outer membrane protein assembly factor BamA